MKRFETFLFICRCLSFSNSIDRNTLREKIREGNVNWAQVAEIASRHLITAALYQGFIDKDLTDVLPGEFHEYLKTVHRLNSERNQNLLAEAVGAARLLNHVGIEPVLLKGIANLASGLYNDPGIRILADIDILVAEKELTNGVNAFTKAGYKFEHVEDFADIIHHHLPPLTREGAIGSIEIHRKLDYQHLLSSDEIRFHSEVLNMNGLKARILSPQDRISHTIIHDQINHQGRYLGSISLRQLYDFVLLRRAHEGAIDWMKVRNLFDEAGRGDAFRIYLWAAERFFDQPSQSMAFFPPVSMLARRRLLFHIAHRKTACLESICFVYAKKLHDILFDESARKRFIRRMFSMRMYRNQFDLIKKLFQSAL